MVLIPVWKKWQRDIGQFEAELRELAATAKVPEEEALKLSLANSRDKNRTPNQWANAANAGFCPAGVEPWLPVNPAPPLTTALIVQSPLGSGSARPRRPVLRASAGRR